MRKFLILISFFACSLTCAAQNIDNVFGDVVDSVYNDEIEEIPAIQPDTTLIKNTHFVSEDSIRSLKMKKEFAYVASLDSLLQKESSRTDKRVKTSLSLAERFLNSAFFRFFVWLVPIALVVFVLYNFFKAQGSFTKKKKTTIQADNEEDIQNTNYDYLGLAREAATQGQYRPAVKYLFLRTLQQLSAAGLINYASDKTNYNYVQEINADKRREFAKLVLNYEYVWYGNVVPEASVYAEIENQFSTFLKKYNLG